MLLDDYERETSTAEVRALFDELKPPLVELIAKLRDRDVDDSFLRGEFPPERQRALAHEVVDRFGHRPESWRHRPDRAPVRLRRRPSTTSASRRTTSRTRSSRSSRRCTSTGTASTTTSCRPACNGCRPACLLARHPRVAEPALGEPRRPQPAVLALLLSALQATYPEQFGGVELGRFHAAITRVQPSFIRIKADEVTYGLHVMLRFELEQDIVNGRVELRDLPEAWNRKMWDYLGVEVPDDARGVLQDIHWAGGMIGYFSTYLLGTVMSVQIWDAAQRDLPDLEAQVERGEFAPLREWLGEHVHALGRKFPPQETLRRATGSTIAPARTSRTCARSTHSSPGRGTRGADSETTGGLQGRHPKGRGGDPRRRSSASSSRGRRSRMPVPWSTSALDLRRRDQGLRPSFRHPGSHRSSRCRGRRRS